MVRGGVDEYYCSIQTKETKRVFIGVSIDDPFISAPSRSRPIQVQISSNRTTHYRKSSHAHVAPINHAFSQAQTSERLSLG